MIFSATFQIFFERFFEWLIVFKGYDRCYLFCYLSIITLDGWLYIIGFKLSHDLSKTANSSVIWLKHFFKAALNGFGDFEPMTDVAYIVVEYQIGVFTGYNSEAIMWF